jgi:hypothetical protein
LVNIASPDIDATVEVDCVVKAGAPKKVDDHLTSNAVMTNDHRELIRSEVIGPSSNLRHWDMQSDFQSANVRLSRLPDIENHMLLSSTPHVRKLADRDCLRSGERLC